MKRFALAPVLMLTLSFVLSPPAAGRGTGDTTGGQAHPPLSGIVGVEEAGRQGGTVAAEALPAEFTTTSVRVGPNDNVIRGDTVNTFFHPSGPACYPGDQVPQNETVIAHNPEDPLNLVGGSNDYRRFVESEQRYEGSGIAYVSFTGGRHWRNVPLPGIHEEFGGTYQAVGDPVVAWDPRGIAVYYTNIAFNRTQTEHHSPFASAISISRSANGGRTWKTFFVVEDDDPTVFHDKEWVAVAPNGVIFVAWARFLFDDNGNYQESPIVFSRSRDGGQTWTPPRQISVGPFNQFAVPAVAPDGTVYISYENYETASDLNGRAFVARSTDGGRTWTNHFVAPINDLPFRPPPLFRWNSGPVTTVGDDGTVHMVWSPFQGTGDIVYTSSTDRAETWTPPVKINQEAVPSDQFFPWIDASGDFIHVGFVDRQYTANVDPLFDHSYVVSTDGGDTWSQTVRVTTESSRSTASLFGALCTSQFIGDYTGITAIGNRAHVLWTDGRAGNQPTSPTLDNDDHDAYHARVVVRPEAIPER